MRGALTKMRLAAATLWLAALLSASPLAAEDTNGIIVYQTDFGLKDGAVSAMRGVAVRGRPDACGSRT